MGVVYKLVPEVSSFIIEQKQNDPKITCQNLAGQVFLRFGERVSKSSVHELLKQSHVITPRAHKKKEKFQIPLEKKFEISKALSPFIETPRPLLEKENINTSIVQEEKEQVSNKTLQWTENIPNAGTIFLKAALWDLSFKPVLGIKKFSDIDSIAEQDLKKEWDYLTQVVYAIEIETQKGRFYIDPRFQGIYSQNPNQEDMAVPIERAACEVADRILNNISPLIVRKIVINDEFPNIYDIFSAFEGTENIIKKISLIGKKGRSFAEFNDPLIKKRLFILNIEGSFAQAELKGINIYKEERSIIVTNLLAYSYEEIRKSYIERHPKNPQKVSPLITNVFQEKDPDLGGVWLKKRLKERALMFFSASFDPNFLEEVLNLPGREAFHDEQLELYLQVSTEFHSKEEIRSAAENINSLDIKDFLGRNLRIFINE